MNAANALTLREPLRFSYTRPTGEGCYGNNLGHVGSLRRHFYGYPCWGGLYGYTPYLPARLHDEFDAWAKGYASPFDDLIVATANRNSDHELRIAEMDADGVAAEVLLPNSVPPFFPSTPNITISLPHTRAEFERWAGVSNLQPASARALLGYQHIPNLLTR